MKVHSKILSAEHAYAFFSGGRKTFNWNGKMVWPLCYALVQEEKNQGPKYQFVLGENFHRFSLKCSAVELQTAGC